MPIQVKGELHRFDEASFRALAYDAMRCVFEIHNELGRFFEEKIYQREFARRFPHAEIEVPIKVTFEDFSKMYFLDVLLNNGAVFEFKTVEVLAERHRAQLMHYLLLGEIPRGKLINMRTEQVQHEFVNAPLRLADRTRFEVVAEDWQECGDIHLQEWFVLFLRHIGAGLEISLYEEALTHRLGGEERALQEVAVLSDAAQLGQQKFRLAAPDAAIKVTAMSHPENFEIHARRLLHHTTLKAVQWINVTRKEVMFRTIRK